MFQAMMILSSCMLPVQLLHSQAAISSFQLYVSVLF